MSESNLEIANKLRAAREYLGYSQLDVATRLNISRSAVSLIESGQRRVTASELQDLAKLFKKPIGFFTGEEARPVLTDDVAILTRKVDMLSAEDRKALLGYTEFLLQQAKSRETDG